MIRHISRAILLSLFLLPQAALFAQLQLREVTPPGDIRKGDYSKPGLRWEEGSLVGDRWLNLIEYGSVSWGSFGPTRDDLVAKWICVLSLDSGKAKWFVPSGPGGTPVRLSSGAFDLDGTRTVIPYRLENESKYRYCIWNLETYQAEDVTSPTFGTFYCPVWINDLPQPFAKSYPTYDDAIEHLQMRLQSNSADIRTTPAYLQSRLDEVFYLIPTLTAPVAIVDTGGRDGPQVAFFPEDLKTPSPKVITSKQLEEACQQTDCDFLTPTRWTSTFRTGAVYLAASFGRTRLYGVRIKDEKIANTYELDQVPRDLAFNTISASGRYHAYCFIAPRNEPTQVMGDYRIQIFDYQTQKLSSYSFDEGRFLGMLDNGDMVRVFLYGDDNNDHVVVRTFRLTSEDKWKTVLEYSFPRSDKKGDDASEQP